MEFCGCCFFTLRSDTFRHVGAKHRSVATATLFLATISLTLLLSQTVEATVTPTAATGGSAISADTNATNGTGAFTTLTGPVLAEGAVGDIGTGTIILNAPTGFEFNTAANSVMATVTTVGGGSTELRVNGTTSQMVTPTVTTITITVTQASSTKKGGTAC